MSRHPSSQRFADILTELLALHDQKQQGYGRAEDPFANLRASSAFGIPPHVGALVRLNDKVVRLQVASQRAVLANVTEQFLNPYSEFMADRIGRGIKDEIDKELPFESISDNLRDIAVYATIALVLYEEAQPVSELVELTQDLYTEDTLRKIFPADDPTFQSNRVCRICQESADCCQECSDVPVACVCGDDPNYGPHSQSYSHLDMSKYLAEMQYVNQFASTCPACKHNEYHDNDDCRYMEDHSESCLLSSETLPAGVGTTLVLPKYNRPVRDTSIFDNKSGAMYPGAIGIETLITTPTYEDVRAEFDKGPDVPEFVERDDLATRAYRMSRDAEAAD